MNVFWAGSLTSSPYWLHEMKWNVQLVSGTISSFHWKRIWFIMDSTYFFLQEIESIKQSSDIRNDKSTLTETLFNLGRH